MAFSVCVFCGARNGLEGQFADAADTFGRELAARDMRLVYGGGRVGLMGVVADGVLDMEGQITGVIPDFLMQREIAHPDVADNQIVDDLFERKAVMIENADAFVALPGGIGTYDEILEVLAWRQLRQLRQPIGLLNIDNYFEPFIELLRHTIRHGFLREDEISHLLISEDPIALIDSLAAPDETPL